MERAQRYVEAVGAAHVFPCAGPPCFLDPDLFALNDLDRDPANIFPDQTVFLEQLASHGIDNAQLIVPGSVVELDGRRGARSPSPTTTCTAPFTHKREYLEQYAQRLEVAARRRARAGPRPGHDLVAELAAWFEPLLVAGADHVGRDRGQHRPRRR